MNQLAVLAPGAAHFRGDIGDVPVCPGQALFQLSELPGPAAALQHQVAGGESRRQDDQAFLDDVPGGHPQVDIGHHVGQVQQHDHTENHSDYKIFHFIP